MNADLVALWFLRDTDNRTSIAKKPYILRIFKGGSAHPTPPPPGPAHLKTYFLSLFIVMISYVLCVTWYFMIAFLLFKYMIDCLNIDVIYVYSLQAKPFYQLKMLFEIVESQLFRTIL